MEVRVIEISTERDGKRHTEYIVVDDGLVKTTQAKVLGRGLNNLLFDSCFDKNPKAIALRDTLTRYFDEN